MAELTQRRDPATTTSSRSVTRKVPISLPVTGEAEWLAAKEPLLSGWLTQGPKVAEFERNFAKRHDVPHALATTSCTTALHLILAGMNVGPGDEVIVPSFTWVATANVALYCGATPILVDIDTKTFNIDPLAVKKAISPRTKAIIAVHLFGLCADMDALRQVAGGIPIIEDAACAAGARYKGVSAGALGLAAAFSFHPRKSITTGEGGMVTTKDKALNERMEMMRNHGASISEEQRHHGPQPYILPDFNVLGFNYRMTDLQGAVGLKQLEKLDTFISERARWAAYYRERLSVIPWLKTPEIPAGYEHGWQSFVCMVDPQTAPMPRNQIMQILNEKGISTRPGTHAIHLLGYYREKFGYKAADLPNATFADKNSMAIPLHNRMTADDYDYVIDALLELNRG